MPLATPANAIKLKALAESVERSLQRLAGH